MVQLLPDISFGSQLAKGLGAGLGAGVSTATDFASKLALKKSEMKQRQSLINQIENPQATQSKSLTPESLDQQFLDALPQIEQALGRDLTSQDLDQLYSQAQQLSGMGQQQSKQSMQQEDPFRKAKLYAVAGEHDLSRVAGEEARSNLRSEQRREEKGEPKLLEIQDRLEKAEDSEMRFQRLGELSSPENEKKMPPGFLVGLFTKEGEIIPEAYASLSPEAQEYVKLVTDELTGAKGTFGSRLTNFDVSVYLKRLPSLLQSAEGKRRVLKDLSIINKINTLHDQGVLDTVNRYGGPSKISISKAKEIWKKENAPMIKQMRQEFVNPEKAQFKDLPDVKMYQNREVIDEETGQKFKSNGKEWVLQ